MTRHIDTLLLHATVVTMDADYTIYSDGGVAIDGADIVAVGSAETLSNQFIAKETVDCSGHFITPGLVNSHTHAPMTLLRGLNDDLRLDVWLGYLMPVERQFVTPDFVRLGTQIACAEMIRSGVTCFADMFYYESHIAAETAKIGMRGLLGQTVLQFPSPDASTYEDALELCRQFIKEWNGHELIQPAVAPHAWYTATPELLTACADLARAHDVPLHTHVSETAIEVENCRDLNDMPVVPWIKKHGLLDTKLLAAHCVHIDRGEISSLVKYGAGIAHCPSSNLKLASGIAPVAELVEAGAKVGIGTDGPASNNDLDMFEETRLAGLVGKVKRNDPTDLPARKVFELATIGGARALHFDQITGSLEAGKRADIAIVSMEGVHTLPAFASNPDSVYSRLVYTANSNDVQHVICHGRWLMRDRQLMTIDIETAKVEAAKVAVEIDAFVRERESSPYNKLIVLEGVVRQESFEVQIKVPLAEVEPIIQRLASDNFEVTKQTRYKQYDQYFVFEGQDPDANRLRFREDEFVDEQDEPYEARSRLTLLGDTDRQAYPGAVMLSRSRWLAPATNTLRFYREYFDPSAEIEVHKRRLRYRLLYEGTDFAINLDQVIKPQLDGYFLEVKARTWSRTDAERKAALISQLLDELGVVQDSAERREYVELAVERLAVTNS